MLCRSRIKSTLAALRLTAFQDNHRARPHRGTPHATRRRVRPLEPPARGTTTEHHGGSRFRPLHAAPRAFRAVEGQGEARHQGEMRARARGVHGKQDRGCRRGGRPQGAPPRGTLLRIQLQGHPPPYQVRATKTRAAARDRGGARNARSTRREIETSCKTRACIYRDSTRLTSSTDISPPSFFAGPSRSATSSSAPSTPSCARP